jgi:hypothetical protein
MNSKRLFANIIGLLWAPFLFIKLILDHFDIYLKHFGTFDQLSLRVLYRLTRGKIIKIYQTFDLFFNRLLKFKRLKKIKIKNNRRIIRVIASLKNDGFYLFPEKIKIPKEVREIYKSFPVYADPNTSSNIIHRYENIKKAKLDHQRLNTRFFYYSQDFLKEDLIWKLICKKSIWDIAFNYLGDNFCLQAVNSWSLVKPTNNFLKKSHYLKNKLYSQQAQSFHYDLDWPRFIKFFICIDDATSGSGAFEYALKTNNFKDKKFFCDKRINKKELNEFEIKCLLGKAGTYAAADTIGFHRDGRPKNKERTVLQLEFSSSVIGSPRTRTQIQRINLSSKSNFYINQIIDIYPRSFRAIIS